jgi:hypothetical protein
MKLNQFKYKTVIDLGFIDEVQSDTNYFNEHGYEYSIITKKLTKLIYIDWCKETKECELIRLDNLKEMNIVARLQIRDINHLHELINFFTNQFPNYDYSKLA